MTIQDVFDRLRPISQAARQLLKDTGFQPDDRQLTFAVRPLPDRCEDAFLRSKAEEILDQLADICQVFRYLEMPSHGEHTLSLLKNGRYGYLDDDRHIHEFTCGDRLEVKIRDRYGDCRWIISTMEHDGADYFLTGTGDTPLNGLTVRERW